MRKLIVLLLIILIIPVSAVEQISIPALPRRSSTTKVNIVIDTTFFSGSDLTIYDIMDDVDKDVVYPGYVDYAGIYGFEVTYTNLTQVQHDSFISYLVNIEKNATGYHVNSSTSPATFEEYNGISYDANETVYWLADNLWNGDSTAYTLFLFNLEELDTELEHWFSIEPKDVDTETYPERFFSGTSGLKSGKQVSAWGGVKNIPIQFIDISSRVWFGDFINNVWGGYYSDSTLVNTISDFVDRTSLSYRDWLRSMVQPFFRHLFSNRLFTSTIVEQYDIPSVVITDDVSNLDEDWVISTDKIEATLNNSFPFVDFNVTADWQLLSDHKDLSDAIDMYKQYDAEKNVTYIELQNGFLNWLQNNMLDKLFGIITDNKIPSLILFMDIEFRYGGVAIAGLGGMGWQFQIMNKDRFYVDGVKDRGFSMVLLHEIGHSMGFYHPFEIGNAWITDFSASIMGYYTSYPDFSLYDKDAFARLYADYYLVQAEYLKDASLETSDADMRNILEGDKALELALEAYNITDYTLAVELSKNAIFSYQNENGLDTDDTTYVDNSSDTNSDTKPSVEILNYPYTWIVVVLLPILIKYNNNKQKY